MQELTDAGCRFTHAFVASPACAPSRAALLTGLMPARNGAESNHTFKKNSILSLPDALRSIGYETAAFGKVAHGPKDIERHGFDHHDRRHDTATVAGYLATRNRQKPLYFFVGAHEPHVPWPDLDGYDPLKVRLPPRGVRQGLRLSVHPERPRIRACSSGSRRRTFAAPTRFSSTPGRVTFIAGSPPTPSTSRRWLATDMNASVDNRGRRPRRSRQGGIGTGFAYNKVQKRDE